MITQLLRLTISRSCQSSCSSSDPGGCLRPAAPSGETCTIHRSDRRRRHGTGRQTDGTPTGRSPCWRRCRSSAACMTGTAWRRRCSGCAPSPGGKQAAGARRAAGSGRFCNRLRAQLPGELRRVPKRTTRSGLARSPVPLDAEAAIRCARRSPLLTADGLGQQAPLAVALSAERPLSRAAGWLPRWTS
jgi:hypothetical protein